MYYNYIAAMAEILTYNTPSDSEKRKVKQNSPWFVSKSVYSWFRVQDKFTKFYILAFLMIAVSTPYIVSQYLNYSQKAAPPAVQENSFLKVDIISPADGDFIKTGSATAIVANVPVAVKVNSVDFYIDGVLKCTVNTSPYVCNWKVPRASGVVYSITAKATGVTGTSALDMIKVTSQ